MSDLPICWVDSLRGGYEYGGSDRLLRTRHIAYSHINKKIYKLKMHFEMLWESKTYESAGHLNEGWRTYWAEYFYGIA